jgi:alpha-beta hydrolase superfamily lysophospholipase
MKRFGKWLGRLILLGVILAAGLWIFGPREPAQLDFTFDSSAFNGDLDAYFAASEGRFDDIVPDTQKRVIWAGAPGVKTQLSLVYIHGFSASAQEIAPVPQRLAAGLGANLVFTRLQGHGRGGDAMAEATVAGWARDTAEAIRAGQIAGEEVIVISTSTGGTLVAAAALDRDLMQAVKGLVFVSPNFGVNNPAAPLLTLPAARYILPPLVGAERSFEPANDAQARFWTTRYPTVAVLPMAAMVKSVVAMDFATATSPALFWFHPDDRVVRADMTADIVARWGGPVTTGAPDLTEVDDPYAHVIAGDILSPGQTETAVQMMRDWIEGL